MYAIIVFIQAFFYSNHRCTFATEAKDSKDTLITSACYIAEESGKVEKMARELASGCTEEGLQKVIITPHMHVQGRDGTRSGIKNSCKLGQTAKYGFSVLIVYHLSLKSLTHPFLNSHACQVHLLSTCSKVKWGNPNTNFDLSGLLPPTNGQHPRCLCYRIQ